MWAAGLVGTSRGFKASLGAAFRLGGGEIGFDIVFRLSLGTLLAPGLPFATDGFEIPFFSN
jgi:hypothetical protein